MFKAKPVKAIIWMAMFLAPGFLYAQYSLEGKVLNEANEPLVGVNIQVANSLFRTSTNASGVFEMKGMPGGTYTLRLSHLGYQTKELSVELNANRSIQVVMDAKIYLSDEAIVEGTRANRSAPIAFDELTKEDIASRNYAQDLPILMELSPSLVSTSDAGAGVGYTGLRIRGSDASRINVTVNGIPINDSESQSVFWVNMPDLSSSLESIQIQRGLGTSTNGAGAFGASINLETDAISSSAMVKLENSFGSFNTRRHNISFSTGKINKHLSLTGRASKVLSDGYIDRAESDLGSYYLSLAHSSKNDVVKLIHFAGKERTYQSWYGTPESRINNDDAEMRAHALREGYSENQTMNLLSSGRTYNFYLYEDEVDDYSQAHYQVHWLRTISSLLSSNLAVHYTRGKGFFEQFRQKDELADYGWPPIIAGDTIYQSDLIRRRWLDNHFYGVVGNLVLRTSKLKQSFGGAWNRYEGGHFGDLVWSEFSQGIPKGTRFYNNNGNKQDWNIYAKSELDLGEKLDIFLDLQIRGIDYQVSGRDIDQRTLEVDTSYVFFNPKAGVSLNFSEDNRLFVYLGAAAREPDRNDFVDAQLGRAPKAEQMTNVELGLEDRWRRFSYMVNAYGMFYTNQLVLTGALNDVGTPIRTNAGKSYRVGLELAAGWQLLRNLQMEGNLSLSRNRIASFEETTYDYTNGFDILKVEHKNTDIAFSPSAIAAGILKWEAINNLHFSFTTKYVGRQFLDNTSNSNRMLNAYSFSNFGLNYIWPTKNFGDWSLGLLINNIFDQRYQSNGYTYSYIFGDAVTENFYYPQAGTNYLLNLSLRFD